MVDERIPVQRPAVKLPEDVAGLQGVIDGLQRLYPDTEGYGHRILQTIKQQIERARSTPEEIDALKKNFDAKIANLVLVEMDQFPDKKERLKRGMNEADAANMERILRGGTSIDIFTLPFFDEKNREELRVKAARKMWEKGLVGRLPEKGA